MRPDETGKRPKDLPFLRKVSQKYSYANREISSAIKVMLLLPFVLASLDQEKEIGKWRANGIHS